MKIRFTLAVLMAVCTLFETKAQTEKKSFIVGGTMILQRHNREDPDRIIGSYPAGEFSISPTVGFFVINNLMIGIQPSFSRSWALGQKTGSTTFGIGPQLRYYFRMGKFAVFPEFSASLSKSSVTGYYYDVITQRSEIMTLKQDVKAYRGGLGGTWFVAPNVGIEGVVYYRDAKSSGDFASNKLARVGANLGIQFYFPAKVK